MQKLTTFQIVTIMFGLICVALIIAGNSGAVIPVLVFWLIFCVLYGIYKD